MSEVIEAGKLKQIINKIETIEQERLESTELLKDAFNEELIACFVFKLSRSFCCTK